MIMDTEKKDVCSRSRRLARRLVPRIRQRAMGIRYEWPDASPRRKHQRCTYSRLWPKVSLASGPAPCGSRRPHRTRTL